MCHLRNIALRDSITKVAKIPDKPTHTFIPDAVIQSDPMCSFEIAGKIKILKIPFITIVTLFKLSKNFRILTNFPTIMVL